MTKIQHLQKGTPTIRGYYGVNTVDFIPELLEWTGDKWIFPDGRFIEYPKADVISWVLVASIEMKTSAPNKCYLCGAKLIKCDFSPLYGRSYVHPESSCKLSKTLIFEAQFEDWNKKCEKDTTKC